MERMELDRTSFFDKVGVTFGETYAATSIHGHVLSRRRTLVSALLARENGGRLLDIGCGAGNYIPIARAWGFNYLGLDASEVMVEGCRKMTANMADANVLLASAVSLPVPPASFDAVLSLGVFEYLEPSQRAQAFDELAKAVKPGDLVSLAGGLKDTRQPAVQRIQTGRCPRHVGATRSIYREHNAHRDQPIPPAHC
jgi:SAM-dependent methyltransferase